MKEASNERPNPQSETVVIHAADPDANPSKAVVPPITTATTFKQSAIGEEGTEFSYGRCGNPTRSAYEKTLAALEEGTYATATSSGVAAASLVLELLPKGSHIMVMTGVYGGTHRLFEKLRTRTHGHEFTYMDLNNEIELEQNRRENTRLIWIESPTNPLLRLVDIQIVCALARFHGILTCVDNTFATAYNQKPLSIGADLVMLSTSKYIGGHSDLIGGAVIAKDLKLAKELDFIKTAVGAVQAPFDSYLALRGMKTLYLRMERQCANAKQVAEYLEQHDKVRTVYYPGLLSHEQFGLAKKQMRTGGAVVTIRLHGELKDANRFVSRLKYFVFAESLGGVESMVNHCATMSHGSMSKEAREKIGIYDTTLRLSVGAENIADLLADLKYALSE